MELYKIRIFFSLAGAVPASPERFETRENGEKARDGEGLRSVVLSAQSRKVVSVRAYEEVSFPVQVELWELGYKNWSFERVCLAKFYLKP